MLDGGLVARSCASMSIMFVIEPNICSTKTIRDIQCLGQGCFATAGDDGNLIVWQVPKPLIDNQTS
jgi:hypothetical protein